MVRRKSKVREDGEGGVQKTITNYLMWKFLWGRMRKNVSRLCENTLDYAGILTVNN